MFCDVGFDIFRGMLVEKLVNIIAPHDCLVCGCEDSLLCSSCLQFIGPNVVSSCYKCLTISDNYQVCISCKSNSHLLATYIRTEYKDIAKDIVHKLKFGRASEAAKIACTALMQCMPETSADTIIVPISTTTIRRRQRGYDQAHLIAKQLAKASGLPYSACLLRHGQSRQVGAKRQTRLEQLQNAFLVVKTQKIRGKCILLVDDVLTTGATLESAAETLLKAGARQVSAIVFARA